MSLHNLNNGMSFIPEGDSVFDEIDQLTRRRRPRAIVISEKTAQRLYFELQDKPLVDNLGELPPTFNGVPIITLDGSALVVIE